MFSVLREEVELAHHDTCTFSHRRKGIVRKRDRKPGLLRQELVEPAQLRTAAGKHDATVDKIGGKLWLTVSKGYSYGIDY